MSRWTPELLGALAIIGWSGFLAALLYLTLHNRTQPVDLGDAVYDQHTDPAPTEGTFRPDVEAAMRQALVVANQPINVTIDSGQIAKVVALGELRNRRRS